LIDAFHPHSEVNADSSEPIRSCDVNMAFVLNWVRICATRSNIIESRVGQGVSLGMLVSR